MLLTGGEGFVSLPDSMVLLIMPIELTFAGPVEPNREDH